MFNPQDCVVIADFDGTLIKKEVNGHRITAMSQIVNEKYLTKAGVAEVNRIYETSYPKELDPSIDSKLKSYYMQSWWEKTYGVYHKYKITESMIFEVCDSPLIRFRPKLKNFLKYLTSNNIPLIIFTASTGGRDVIEYLFKKAGMLTPNVSICANDLEFNSDGTFSHAVKPIIHAANKTGVTLIKQGFLTKKPSRRQCLLIGDSLDDVKMCQGLNFDMTYKVAFANPKDPHFQKSFDLVLTHKSSFSPILQLFR